MNLLIGEVFALPAWSEGSDGSSSYQSFRSIWEARRECLRLGGLRYFVAAAGASMLSASNISYWRRWAAAAFCW